MTDHLGIAECFRFPLATRESRRDLVVGGSLLFLLLIGWIWNLGHRLEVVRRVYRDEAPFFRGFRPWGATFLRGLQAFTAIATYLSPAALCSAGAYAAWSAGFTTAAAALSALAFLCFALAVFSLPGGMTYNAVHRDMTYLYRPDKALRRAMDGGALYLRAWGIAMLAILCSLSGLLVLGVGFFYTSVWAWSVVGYAFTRALMMQSIPSTTETASAT